VLSIKSYKAEKKWFPLRALYPEGNFMKKEVVKFTQSKKYWVLMLLTHLTYSFVKKFYENRKFYLRGGKIPKPKWAVNSDGLALRASGLTNQAQDREQWKELLRQGLTANWL
jgi:hypothetical protein